MSVTLYCTNADLATEAKGEEALARLAADSRSAPYLLADADVASALTQAIQDASVEIFGDLAGRLDSGTLAAPDPASVVGITLRTLCVAKVMRALWKRKGMTAKESAYVIAASDALARLKRMAQGEVKIGDSGQPAEEIYTSTGESDTKYAEPARGGSGCKSGRMRGWN